MPDRYQGLRDAIAGPIIRSPRIAVRAAGSICVGDTRPVDTVEDLERGLHIEILGGENTEAEAQFIAAADPDTIAALLADNDKLREALADIGRVAHLIRNTLVSNQVVIDDDGAREHAYALCLEWEEADAKARAALADGEKA